MTRSNRYINTTATCEAYQIQSFDWETSVLVYTLGNGSAVTIEDMLVGDGTTYISQVVDIEDYSSDILSCGPRCAWLTITQIEDITDLRDPWLYFCQSTVHEVEGADMQEELIGDPIALIAATSMSQSGYTDNVGRFYGYYPNK